MTLVDLKVAIANVVVGLVFFSSTSIGSSCATATILNKSKNRRYVFFIINIEIIDTGKFHKKLPCINGFKK
jgi:hypothetical protein